MGRAATECFSQIHGISQLLRSFLFFSSLLFYAVVCKILLLPIPHSTPFLSAPDEQQLEEKNIKRAVVALISSRIHQNCAQAVQFIVTVCVV